MSARADQPADDELEELVSPRATEEHLTSEENILAVRLGHGANCSSVGSVIDMLFVGAAVGGALFAAIAAAMRDEPIQVIGAASGTPSGDALARAETREGEGEASS